MAKKKAVKRKSLYREIHQTVTDADGNTTTETKREEFSVGAEPPFIKLYINDIIALHNLKGKSKDLLLQLIKLVDFENYVTLSPRKRKSICKIIGIKETGSTLTNTINAIIKAGLMKRVSWNEYMLNPDYFARKKWFEMHELQVEYITMKVTYTEDGKRIVENEVKIKDGEE